MPKIAQEVKLLYIKYNQPILNVLIIFISGIKIGLKKILHLNVQFAKTSQYYFISLEIIKTTINMSY